MHDFVRALQQLGIQTLIDVRDLPLSRKQGFSKNVLAGILESNGIEYVHLKGLGDPKSGRDAARAGKLSLFRRIFGRHMTTDAAQRDLARAIKLVRERASCLMCFEEAYCNCHRSIVADHIVARTGMAIHHVSTRGLTSAHEQRSYRPGSVAA